VILFQNTDSKLIQKALSGSQTSWCQLVKRYQSEV